MTPFKKLVADAKSQINETDVTTVKQRQDQGDTFILIDVREKEEWDAARLPGAMHLSKGRIECDINHCVDGMDAELILYCGGGSRSALAALNLKKMGYTNVTSMDGGFRGWKEAGFPLA